MLECNFSSCVISLHISFSLARALLVRESSYYVSARQDFSLTGRCKCLCNHTWVISFTRCSWTCACGMRCVHGVRCSKVLLYTNYYIAVARLCCSWIACCACKEFCQGSIPWTVQTLGMRSWFGFEVNRFGFWVSSFCECLACLCLAAMLKTFLHLRRWKFTYAWGSELTDKRNCSVYVLLKGLTDFVRMLSFYFPKKPRVRV